MLTTPKVVTWQNRRNRRKHMQWLVGVAAGLVTGCCSDRAKPSPPAPNGSCVIESTEFSSGAANPKNACETCQPLVTSSAWTLLSDGATCASGNICVTGACQPGCWIGAAYYPAGARNANNPCQSCDPALSTSRWTSIDSPCVEAIAGGSYHTCALVNGGAQCWGTDVDGDLGAPGVTQTVDPVDVHGLTSGVQALTTGSFHSCAVANGAALCWGSNYYRALGNESIVQLGSAIPVQVQGLASGVQAIAGGEYHTCAAVNGAAWCWGWNALGNNSAEPSGVPVQVEGLTSDVQAITAGSDHSCAIVNGGARCWGANGSGQLGNNTTIDSLVPVQVEGLTSGVQAITAGGYHTCAVVNGGVQCWGEEAAGDIAAPSRANRLTAAPIRGLTSGVETVATGVQHICALVYGSVQCWGSNLQRQLGSDRCLYCVDPEPPVRFRGRDW